MRREKRVFRIYAKFLDVPHFLEKIYLSLGLVFRSLRWWPFVFWLRFWFGRSDFTEVTLGGLVVSIRTSTLAKKIIDLYVAAYCILDRQYQEYDFSIAPSNVIIDIGGHIGSFTLAAAWQVPAGRVIVYEPDKENYFQLIKNITLNNFKNVTAHNLAVGSNRQTRILYHDTINTSRTSFSRPTRRKSVTEVVTLADVFSANDVGRCDFLKMDCEGSEYEILFAAPDELLGRVAKMVVEVHDPIHFKLPLNRCDPKKLLRRLKAVGFQTTIWRESPRHSLVFASRI